MHPSHQVDTGIVMIGPAVTQDDHRRLAVDGVAVLLLKIFEGLTVIGRTKPGLFENFRYRHLDVLFLDDVVKLVLDWPDRLGPRQSLLRIATAYVLPMLLHRSAWPCQKEEAIEALKVRTLR